MKPNLLALILTVAVTTACSGSKSSTPNAGQAQAENPVLGLWLVEHEVDEDLVSDENDPVDLYAEFIEITDSSLIYYVTDGVSNCYQADTFPLENITGTTYQVDYAEIGIFSINIEATSSILTTSEITNSVNHDNTVDSKTETFTRVDNISSQDFNACTFM